MRLRSTFLVVLAAVSPACGGGGPTAVADWRMVERTRDDFTDSGRVGEADREGPDGIVDDYEHAQGPLVPHVNGNISRKFPEDGRYEVVLDACASSGGATRFAWFVDGGAAVESEACETTVRLHEGRHAVALTARDSGGGSDTTQIEIDVKDLVVVGLGDSYSAGSGASRGGLVSADYDNARCTRTGHAAQARAAFEMERRDPHTSVTFIHLACGGAQATTGLLEAHNNQAPQVLELAEVLPAGQVVDFLTMTIGGNDIRFSEIIGQLVEERDAPLTTLDGEQAHARTQRKLLELRERLANVAACFGDGFENRPCQVRGPSGRDEDQSIVSVPRIPIAARNRIVQITYPDLTTHTSGRAIEICPTGEVERPGDLVDGLLDGRAPGGGAGSPILSGAEWAWGDATVLRPDDPAPDDAHPALYAYVPEAGGSPVPLAYANTLNSVILESGPRFGWTANARWWSDSRGHGYCAPASENYFFRTIFHPDDDGYAVEAAGIVAEAEALGVVSPAR
jgi:hypothetical protein